MSVVETEQRDGIFVIRMNRPERLNALGAEMREALVEAWCEFRDSRELEIAIYTGTGRAFCWRMWKVRCAFEWWRQTAAQHCWSLTSACRRMP